MVYLFKQLHSSCVQKEDEEIMHPPQKFGTAHPPANSLLFPRSHQSVTSHSPAPPLPRVRSRVCALPSRLSDACGYGIAGIRGCQCLRLDDADGHVTLAAWACG